MTQQELKHILSSKFDFEKWKDLLGMMFLKIDYLSKPIQIDASLVKSGGQVGTIRLDDGRSLGLFKFEVADNIQIARNRKGLRDIAIRYVDQDIIHGALVFYYSENQADYRLTFVSKQTSLNEDGVFVIKETAPKRYTFLLGENEPCTTASIRLHELVKKQTVYLIDVTDAFSVERLNKDFFNGYKDRYLKFLKYLNNDIKENRDYVKKLLGRLVFLQFLQKKGWMGVPANRNDWEGGDKNYLYYLIKKYDGNDRLLSDVLEVLFFNTLNEKRTNDVANPILGDNIKIPYLNGGLFDKDDLDKKDIDFPYSYFEELMEFFGMYNFTIDENDPDDAEVGVDPEMLGHIFENLLEDNKDKGAFYTPKEIVQYMSEESIAQYLKTHAEEALHSAIEELIKQKKVNEALQNKATASAVYNLLCDVKVCDPAIGSGAFPMGVLNVLYHSRLLLYGFTKPTQEFSPANVKREIIQNNIYGVDIEQGAVDIARLRFWLALVVDAEEPQPLPNLDYKITCGNSLLKRYPIEAPIENVFVEYNKDKKDGEKMTLIKYKELVNDYTNTSNHQKKELFHQIIENIKKAFKTEISRQFLEKLTKLKGKIANIEAPILFGERTLSEKKELIKLKNQLKQLEKELNDIRTNKVYLNAFEWRFEFPQLLDDNGNFMGFDIIIGNPPYIKEATDKNAFDGLRNSRYYQGKMDLWYFFACVGIDLLKTDGILCYIATNNWTTNDGASILRNKVISDTRIIQLIDFSDAMIFDSASIQTMIMLFQKDNLTNHYVFDYRKIKQKKANRQIAFDLLKKVPHDGNIHIMPSINRESCIGELLTFASSNTNQVLQAIKLAGHFNLSRDEVFSGIDVLQDRVNKKAQKKLNNSKKVGDGIFVLNRQEKDNLNLNSNETEIVKPYYTAGSINRYSINSTNNEWIIYTESDINDRIALYPNIKAHLDQFAKVMTSVNKPYGLHRSRKKEIFLGEKILVLRKCVNRPSFSYVDFDSFVSRAFLIIKTKRVNNKYLTGLLNSKLVSYWLLNKGKMQGTNFQIDKEPLMQIPIAIPSKETQDLVASIVDYIMHVSSSKEQISGLISNNTIVDYFERIIDGCVYEIYFEEHMKELEINIIKFAKELIKPIAQLTSEKEKDAIITEVFMTVKKTDNPIRNRLELFSLRSPELLKPIIEN